jgi:hypothetical protein
MLLSSHLTQGRWFSFRQATGQCASEQHAIIHLTWDEQCCKGTTWSHAGRGPVSDSHTPRRCYSSAAPLAQHVSCLPRHVATPKHLSICTPLCKRKVTIRDLMFSQQTVSRLVIEACLSVYIYIYSNCVSGHYQASCFYLKQQVTY